MNQDTHDKLAQLDFQNMPSDNSLGKTEVVQLKDVKGGHFNLTWQT